MYLRDKVRLVVSTIAPHIAIALLLFGCVEIQGDTAAPSDAGKYGIIHRPRSGCPVGFFEVSDVFRLRNRKSPGCVNIRNPNRPMDYLIPGEGWSPVFWGPWGWTKSIWFYQERTLSSMSIQKNE
jgi:hypothetical protein